MNVKRANFEVVLDACVMIPMPLADTLFRMAEDPQLYIPRWSDAILAEVSRNLVKKFHMTPEAASYREKELKKAFPSACVDDGYKELIGSMKNHPKDQHVLAAAVACGSKLIVSYNKKDFPSFALNSFNIQCKGPSTFLRDLYDLEPAIATRKLIEQAESLDLSLEDFFRRLKGAVPAFVDFICEKLSIDLAQ